MNQTAVNGEVLVEKGLLTRDQLNQAITEQKNSGDAFDKVVIRLGFATDPVQIKQLLLEDSVVSAHDDLKPQVDQRLKELIPKDVATQHLILPLERTDHALKIAVADQPDIILIDNFRKMTGCDIITVVTDEMKLRRAIDQFYDTTRLEEVVHSTALDEAKEQYTPSHQPEAHQVDLESVFKEADQAPVVKLVDLFLKKAADDQASDVHIEPFQDTIAVRYRIDGILYNLSPPPKEFHLAVVSRVKILAKMDIAEKRIPQDGSFTLNYQNRQIDIRVSTIPVVHGEKVVMRLLDKRPELLDLKSLGFEDDQLKLFDQAIHRPNGLILLTGPTGSGKSTTLYAAMNQLRSSKVNILTMENPVEYQIEGINQVQVKPEIGLTFSIGLRAFLRQDPDIILVGEIRDQETAEMCIRASLTGHLVLSTLHTNDAASVVTRLVDIGVKPYLVSGSLILAGAQRLIRQLCEHCKEPQRVDEAMRAEFKFKVDTIYKPAGCKKCIDIGYRGRAAIYEIMLIDDDLRRAISRDASVDALRELQVKKGYPTLRSSGLRQVEKGLTSLEEVLSITYE